MREQTIAALDIGTSKICCFIATVGEGKPQVIGIGHQMSKGLKSGTVVDMEETETSIRAAVDTAERMAGVTVEDVHMNISGGRPRCTTLRAEIRVEGGGPVGAHHVSRVVAQATGTFSEPAREVVHVTPSSFHLDGGPAVLLAEGMYADRLGVRVNAVSVDRGPLRNLETMIERCMLRPAGFVIAPYAAARAVQTDDERELGVVVVEVGAASTSVAIFAEGRL
ncbi:MAG: cell division protein FtsA, partial [Emcibacter sp.]|nr:cell division protein FtsA [Emcibacter sp.]